MINETTGLTTEKKNGQSRLTIAAVNILLTGAFDPSSLGAGS
jgi:hypothetical protein